MFKNCFGTKFSVHCSKFRGSCFSEVVNTLIVWYSEVVNTFIVMVFSIRDCSVVRSRVFAFGGSTVFLATEIWRGFLICRFGEFGNLPN